MSGFLTFIIAVTAITVYMSNDLRIDITPTQSKFNVWENNAWVLSGTETAKLYSGSTSISRISSEGKVLYKNYIDDSGKNISEVNVINKYANGVQLIDTYIFQGDNKAKELFPVIHYKDVFGDNAVGLILQYEVSSLAYTGVTRNAVSPESFGHNMKVEWQSGAYYQKITKGLTSSKLTVKYKITSNGQRFYMRLFDPPVGGATIKNLAMNVRPLTAGSISANTQFDYDFVFGNSVTCASPMLNRSGILVTTDSLGVGFVEIDISPLTSAPAYMCEYRDNVLRTVHNISSTITNQIYFDVAKGNSFNTTDLVVENNLTVTGNIVAQNNVSVTGTVIASSFVGDGSQLSGINVVPIGSVAAWLQNYTGTPVLPDGWALANGQNLTDATSPFHHQLLPNLNGASGGTQRFLRGAASSGNTGGADTHSHIWLNTAALSYGSSGNTVDVTQAGGAAVNGDPLAKVQSAARYTSKDTVLPSYYEVVWIIKVH